MTLRTDKRSCTRRRTRGAATVEFALISPLLVTMLMFGMFITDIARVKLKMQEAGRYVAWEMTSYTLSDYANKDHGGHFTEALNKTVLDAQERYKDLDSVEDDAGPMASFSFGQFTANVENQDVQFINTSLIQSAPGGELISDILGAVNRPVAGALGYLGFDTKGRIRSTVNMTVNTNVSALPRNYYDTGDGALYTTDHWGGYDLSQFNMASRYTMVADDWHLSDGGDVVARDGLAGRHNGDEKTGMWLQTKRMTYIGLGNLASKVPGLSTILNYLPMVPGPGTFTVSRNFEHGNNTFNCNFPGHNGWRGMVNQSDILKDDDQDMRCYDTAPFRDTQAYNNSLYRRIFMARGEWFMGCQNPMSDDPTRTQVYSNDEQQDKTICSNQNVAP